MSTDSKPLPPRRIPMSHACPSCHRPVECTFWLVVVADDHPDIAEQARAGTLLDQTCTHCGFKYRNGLPFLYVDRQKTLMVFVAAPGMSDQDSHDYAQTFLQPIQDFPQDELRRLVSRRQFAFSIDDLPRALDAKLPDDDAEFEQRQEKNRLTRQAIEALQPHDRYRKMLELYISGEPVPLIPADATEEFIEFLLEELREATEKDDQSRIEDVQKFGEFVTQLYQHNHPTESAPDSPDERRSIVDILQNFTSTTSPKSCREILAGHPELVTTKTLSTFQRMIQHARDQNDRYREFPFEFKYGLLSRCLEVGIDEAISELGDQWLQHAECVDGFREAEAVTTAAIGLEKVIGSIGDGKPIYVDENMATDQAFAMLKSKIAEAGDSSTLLNSLKRIQEILYEQYVKKIIRKLIEARSLAETRQLLDANPRLLSEESAEPLEHLLNQLVHPSLGSDNFISSRVRLIRHCREVGIATAFESVDLTDDRLFTLAHFQAEAASVLNGTKDLETAKEDVKRWAVEQQVSETALDVIASNMIATIEGNPGQAVIIALLTDTAAGAVANPKIQQLTSTIAGVILHMTGDFPAAAALLERSLSLARAINDVEREMMATANLGLVFRDQGKLTEAERYLQQALTVAQDRNDDLMLARTYANLSALYDNLGNVDLALNLNEKARKIFERLKADSPSDRIDIELAHTLGNAAGLCVKSGDYEQGINICKQALAASQKTEDYGGQCASLSNLSHFSWKTGQLQQAVEYGERALAVATKLGEKNQEGICRNNLGGIWRAIAVAEEKAGRIEAAAEARRKSTAFANEAVAIVRTTDSREHQRIGLTNLGRMYEDDGQFALARLQFLEAVKIAEWQRDIREQPLYREAFQRTSSDLFTRGIGVSLRLSEVEPDNPDYAREAFEFAEAGKSRLLLDIMSQAPRELVAASEPDQHVLQNSEREPSANTPPAATSNENVWRASRQAAETRPSNVAKHEPTLSDAETSACLARKSLDLAATGSALPPDTALLEYALVPYLQTIGLFVVLPGGKLLGGAHRLSLPDIAAARQDFQEALFLMDRQLGPLRRLGTPASPATPTSTVLEQVSAEEQFWKTAIRFQPDIENALERLGAGLIPQSVLKALQQQGIRRLLIVPDAGLFEIPFPALRIAIANKVSALIGEPGADVGFEVVIAPSMSAFDRCRRKMAGRSGTVSPQTATSLLVSDPNFNRDDMRLDGVSGFVEQLRTSIFSADRTTHLTQRDATKNRFREHAPGAHVQLFYGHGSYDFEDALNSSLHFHSDNDTSATDPLSAGELLAWSRESRFDNCSLFAMPACWSIRVDSMQNWDAREIVGMASTLFQRGVASIVGSLWPATVGPASVVFASFFDRYLSGEPASKALREAQLELRKTKHGAHPYFWAPFYLMGDFKAWP